MDTDISDYEIFVTNIIKSYIELLTSRIHRNMISELRSLNNKNTYVLVLAMALFTGIFTAQQYVLASSNSDGDDDSSDSSSSGQTENRGIIGNFADGRRDGLADGASDYRNGIEEFARCPGGSLDYCAGYDNGYHDGYDSARKVG
jgi:hypothetical protein